MTLTGAGGENGDARGVTARPEPEPGTFAAPGPSPAAAPEPEPGTPAAPAAAARLRRPWALAAALAGGLALAAAFPPAGIWPLAPVGPALLAVALWRRGLRASLLAGLVFGLALFVPLLSWLLNVAWYAWLALAVSRGGDLRSAGGGPAVLLGCVPGRWRWRAGGSAPRRCATGGRTRSRGAGWR